MSATDLIATWSQLAAFVSAVETRLDRWLNDRHRLGLTEYRALTTVGQQPDRELRVNELALRLGLNQSSATRLVSRLETKGFARRELCDDDGRGVYAALSEAGSALLREIDGPFEEHAGGLLREAATQFPRLKVDAVLGALSEVQDVLRP